MGESGYLSIKGIKPDEESPSTGEIDFCTNSLAPARRERYYMEEDVLVAESCVIPMPFIINFLMSNGCVRVDEKGEECVVLREVKFEMNN